MRTADLAVQSKPGEFPFLRGVHPDMYRKKLWTMRQYSGFGGPDLTNQRFKKLIADGGTNIEGALAEAFRLESGEGRIPMVIF